jgi:hypothetical protein
VRRSLALRSGRQSARSGVTAGTASGRGKHVVALVVALLLLGFAVGLHPIVEYRDLTCRAGAEARYVSVAYWAVRCEPNEASVNATTLPTSRYIGLFLTRVDFRVFEMDFLAGNFRGPGRA